MSWCECKPCKENRKAISEAAAILGGVAGEIVTRIVLADEDELIEFIAQEMQNKHTAAHAAASAGMHKEASEIASYGLGMRIIADELKHFVREVRDEEEDRKKV